MRRGIEYVDQRQAVPAPDLEIVEVVRGRDLHRAGAFFWIGVFVGDHWNTPTDQRQDRRLANQMLEPLVLRVHRDGDVAQHGLGPRGGDDDEFARAFDRIYDVPELALGLDLLHFEVGDRGLKLGVPVDEALVLKDQAIAV